MMIPKQVRQAARAARQAYERYQANPDRASLDSAAKAWRAYDRAVAAGKRVPRPQEAKNDA